jgi:hypothetical protein
MATHSVANRAGAAPLASTSFERLAGACGILAGVGGFLYAVSFVVLQNPLLNSILLMLNSLLATTTLVAIYNRLREADAGFALWGLLLGTVGALGAAVHGGYDLANVINPPTAASTDLPNQIDPRGLLTFGVTGLGLLALAWLMGRTAHFPKGLGYLGYALSALLVIIYLARMIVLDPTNPILLVPVLAAGFLVNPAWYIWTGVTLRRGRAQ